jgi:hypothetical protein
MSSMPVSSAFVDQEGIPYEQALISSLCSLVHGVFSRAVKVYFLHFVVTTVFVHVGSCFHSINV